VPIDASACTRAPNRWFGRASACTPAQSTAFPGCHTYADLGLHTVTTIVTDSLTSQQARDVTGRA